MKIGRRGGTRTRDGRLMRPVPFHLATLQNRSSAEGGVRFQQPRTLPLRSPHKTPTLVGNRKLARRPGDAPGGSGFGDLTAQAGARRV